MNEKQLYETVMLSLQEPVEETLTSEGRQRRDALLEILPVHWQNTPEVRAALSLLTGTGESRITEWSADPKETERLLRNVQKAQTEADWSEAMQALASHSMDALDPLLTMELLG